MSAKEFSDKTDASAVEGGMFSVFSTSTQRVSIIEEGLVASASRCKSMCYHKAKCQVKRRLSGARGGEWQGKVDGLFAEQMTSELTSPLTYPAARHARISSNRNGTRRTSHLPANENVDNS